MHQRSKIPRLSFNGYFKREQAFVTGQVSTKVTTYYVRIENINPKGEGQIERCAGTLIAKNNEYKTVWISDKRHHNFVKEAWLKLFDVDMNDDTIGFFDTRVESNVKRSPASKGRRIGDNITMQVVAAH